MFVGDFGAEFGLESVSFDPIAVIFLFKAFEFGKGGFRLLVPIGEGLGEGWGVVAEEGMGLEVPGGFKIVPVFIGNQD